MKPLTSIFVFLAISIGTLFQSYCQTIRAITFNIRLETPVDGKNIWDNRKVEMLELINYYHPDFLGVQEALPNQMQYISNGLKHYSYIGVGREDGKEMGEFSAIFYDTLQFDLVQQETFWLSESFNNVSIGWDAALERICTYGLFKHKKSGDLIYVFNTHFDHIGKIALVESAKLILRRMEEIATPESRVILMGDFNCEPESEPIKILKSQLDCGSEVSPSGIYGPTGTFNGFNENLVIDRRIDYVFVKNLSVIKYRHVDDRMKNNNFISDHYPVLVDLEGF
jgi:endonuclease/exonuclease/phosphatase family metal-dependent hydrolase